MDSSLEEMEDSSNELDIAKDINGCIQSLDDDIGPNYNAVIINDGTTKSTNSSRSSSTSSTSSSSSGSSSSSSSSASSISKKTPPVVVVTKVQADTKQKSELYTKKLLQAPIKSLELSQLVPERVLYPAKLARKPLELSPADPHWMRNDIHQKFSRPKTSSTGNTPAAHRKSRSRSKVRGKCESGYKTDNSVNSNKSGYPSDRSMAANQRRRRKSRAPSRDPSTSRNYPQAAPGDIDDLAKLMGLHLDTNESSSSTKYNIDLKKNDTNNNQNRQRKPLATSYLGYSGAENLNRQLLDRKIALTSKSAFHNAIKSGSSFLELARQSKTMQEWSLDDTTVLPIKSPKSLGRGISIKSRRMSTQSRTGSVRSASSNISRLRRGTQNPQHSAWIEAEINNLNGSFKKLTIAPARYHHQDVKSKRQNKKKKMSEAHLAMNLTPNTKRKTKKLEPEDHKLPLKKRTYLLADGANVNDNKSKKATDKKRRVDAITVKVQTKTISKLNRPTKSKNIPPAGIFEPSSSLIDSQLQLVNVDDLLIPTPVVRGGVVDNLLNKTGAGDVIEVSKRKRRRVNRTGFPNKKRPKKKVVVLAEQQQKVTLTNVKITKLAEQEMKLTPRQLTLRQIKEQKEEEIQPLIIEKKRRKTITIPDIIPLRPRRNTMYQEPLPIVPEPEIQLPPQKKFKAALRRLTVFQEQMPVIDEHPVSITKRQRARRKTLCEDNKHKLPKIELTTSKVEVDQHPVTIIAKNKYQPGVEKKAYQDSLIAGKCDCKKLKNECDEQCHNRSMCIECDVKICGKDCTNTAITTNRLVKGVEKYLTPQKGWGVRTTDNIYKKQLILEYTGEVMFKEIFKERMQTIYKDDRHHYCLEIGNNIVIDGHRMGSLCRFVNHSCKPNCKMAKVQVDGLPRMVLQADMDIPAGTELTYDYKFLDFESSEPQTCYCGEDICRGTLSAPHRRGSFTVKDGEPSGRKGGGRKAKGRILKQCPMKVSCFLNRNLRKIERNNPELLAIYKNMLENLDDDPKAGFVFYEKQRDVQSVIGSPLQIPDVTELMIEPLVILEELSETIEIPEEEVSTTEQTQFLLSICNQLLETKDEAGKHCYKLIAIPQKISTQTDEASNHDRISNPMCFDDIIKAVKTGVYDDRPHVFNYNIKILLDNCVKFYGVNCQQFCAMKLLKDKFCSIKKAIKDELKRLWIDDFMTDEFLEIKLPTKSKRKFPKADQEDVIQCICGMFLEEGVMVQCSTCKCWQHVDCVHADTNLADYYCEKCEPRTVDYEIVKTDELLNDNQCFLTLMRGDTLQVRVGDAIYVLLDIKIKDEAGNEDQSHTYKTIGNVSYDRCDIVRVDSLFKDADGKSFVVGHHYIRPHEVFHEPTRKFYNNELMRGTAFETIPIEMVIDTCWVLDTSTYFKGRPLNSVEKHVYVAEFKVDKGCKQFTTIKSKSRQPVCTKNYAFYKYEEQLKQKRTAMPHKIEEIPKKQKKDLLKKAGPRRPQKGALRFQKLDSRRSAIKQKLLRLESSVYRLKQNIPSTSTAECSGVAGRFDIAQFRESYLDWLPEPMMRLVRDVRSQTPGKRSFRRSQTPLNPVELIEDKVTNSIRDKNRAARSEIRDFKKKSRSRTPVKIVKKPVTEKLLDVSKTIVLDPEKVHKTIIKDDVEAEPLKTTKKKIKVIREKTTIIEDLTMFNAHVDLETMITPSRIDKKHKATEKIISEIPTKKKKLANESQIKKISEVHVKVDKPLKVPSEVSKSRSSERTRLQPLRTKSKSPSAVKEKKESSNLSIISKIDESVKKDSIKSVKKDHKEVVKSHSSSDKSYKDPRNRNKNSDRHERESPSGDRKSRSRKPKSHDRNSKRYDKDRSREVVNKSSSKVSSRDSKKSSVHHSKDAKEVKGDSRDAEVFKNVSKSSKESSSKKSRKKVSKDSKSKDSRDSRKSKDNDSKSSKDVKSSKDKESKDSKISKDSKNSKTVKESKDSKSSKDSKDNKVVKDVTHSKDSKENMDNKESKEIKESVEVKKVIESKVISEVKEIIELKDNKTVMKQDSTMEVLNNKETVTLNDKESLLKDKKPAVTSVEKSDKSFEKSSKQQANTSESIKEQSSIVDKSKKSPIQLSQRATRSRTPGRTKDTATASTNVSTSM